jgi:excisionase family DNA binding protein
MSYSNPWPQKIALTLEECCIAGGLGRRTLQRAIAEGKLPSAFVCGRRRITPRALERFMQGLPPESTDTPRLKTVSCSVTAARFFD